MINHMYIYIYIHVLETAMEQWTGYPQFILHLFTIEKYRKKKKNSILLVDNGIILTVDGFEEFGLPNPWVSQLSHFQTPP